MVKVITRREPTEKAKRISCTGCNSRLEFKPSEARLVEDQRDGDAYVIKCPVCQADNWVAI